MTKVLIVTSLKDPFRLYKMMEKFGDVVDSLTVSNHLQPCDYGISFLYTKKIPKSALVNPWINFHPGPLPEYKGRNVIYHAIMNGEKEFGASVHYVDENFDTGPIIDVVKFPILGHDTAEDIHALTIEWCYALLDTWFTPFVTGKELPTRANVGGTYYHKEPINDYLIMDKMTEREIRAITFGKFYPKIKIGNDTYKIVRDK